MGNRRLPLLPGRAFEGRNRVRGGASAGRRLCPSRQGSLWTALREKRPPSDAERRGHGRAPFAPGHRRRGPGDRLRHVAGTDGRAPLVDASIPRPRRCRRPRRRSTGLEDRRTASLERSGKPRGAALRRPPAGVDAHRRRAARARADGASSHRRPGTRALPRRGGALRPGEGPHRRERATIRPPRASRPRDGSSQPDELRSRFQSILGSSPADSVVSYCGSGVTACHNLLAMDVAGLRGARLYPGSWSEWSADEKRPIERGKEGKV